MEFAYDSNGLTKSSTVTRYLDAMWIKPSLSPSSPTQRAT